MDKDPSQSHRTSHTIILWCDMDRGRTTISQLYLFRLDEIVQHLGGEMIG